MIEVAPASPGASRPGLVARRPGVVLAAPLLCAIVACAASSSTVGAGGESGESGGGGEGGAGAEALDVAPGVTTDRVVWTLAWDLSGTEPLAGGGHAFTTDLGYRVELTSGTVVIHSLMLWPCPAPEEASLLSWLVRPAHAHEASDPSALELGVEEDLSGVLAPVELVAEFPAARYCDAHWLIAFPPQGVGPTTERTSLALAGRWSKDGASGSFAIDTWWPQGALATLPATPEVDPPRGVWVRVERVLARTLDGVELATARDELLTDLVLHNLVANARVTIDVDRP